MELCENNCKCMDYPLCWICTYWSCNIPFFGFFWTLSLCTPSAAFLLLCLPSPRLCCLPEACSRPWLVSRRRRPSLSRVFRSSLWLTSARRGTRFLHPHCICSTSQLSSAAFVSPHVFCFLLLFLSVFLWGALSVLLFTRFSVEPRDWHSRHLKHQIHKCYFL